MTIPAEAWPILLGLCAAVGYWLRRQADARTEQEKTARIAAESQLMQVESDAQTKLLQVQADADERAFIRQQFLAQIKINEQHEAERAQYEKRLAEVAAKNESNYQVVSNVQKDTNFQIANLVNAIGALNKSILERIDGLPAKIAEGNAESLKVFAKEMGAEMGGAMAQQFAIQNLDRDLFPFPDPEDPAWKDEWVTPITPEPTLHKQPYFSDAVKLHKPCSQIATGGEKVRLIRSQIKGWFAIHKIEGNDHCWGWLPEHTIKIGALPQGSNA